jgi:hypothetical protein
LGTASATGTIRNDDVAPQPVSTGVNDTGITGCSTEIADDLDCADATAGTDAFPGQDAEYGRDATNNNDTDGRAGFAFRKLDATGVPLADQNAAYAVSPWSCVEDLVTGLIWEVKDSAGNDRDAAATYSWYNSSGVNDGGDPGVADGGACPTAGGCDTESFVATLNAAQLCGFSNWRLPRRGEVLSLVDFGAAAPPLIDTGYFPNAIAGPYWTASTEPRRDLRTMDFATGVGASQERDAALAVRLVTGE